MFVVHCMWECSKFSIRTVWVKFYCMAKFKTFVNCRPSSERSYASTILLCIIIKLI